MPLPAGNINPGRIVEVEPLSGARLLIGRSSLVKYYFDEFMGAIADRIDRYFDRTDTFYFRLFRTKVVTQAVPDCARLDSLGRQIPILIERRMIGFVRYYGPLWSDNHAYLTYCLKHGDRWIKDAPEVVWPLYQDCVGSLKATCYVCDVVLANEDSEFKLVNFFYGRDFTLPDWRELCV